MRTLALLPLALAALLAGCGHDDAVPTNADNAAMDAAANDLDNAAAHLNEIDGRLPAADGNGPPAEANGPSKP